MLTLMRRLLSLVVSWALLVLLWIAYVGTLAGTEVLAGVGAAFVAVVALEIVRAQGLLHFRADRAWLARAWTAPARPRAATACRGEVPLGSVPRGRRARALRLAPSMGDDGRHDEPERHRRRSRRRAEDSASTFARHRCVGREATAVNAWLAAA